MPEYSELSDWLEPAESSGVDVGALKQAMFKRGVNSRGWRLYLDHGDVMFAPLRTHWFVANKTHTPAEVAVSWLRLLQACEMDVLPPLELVGSIASWNLPHEGIDVIPPLFLRAAWKACIAAQYSEGDAKPFVADQLTPLAQWFFCSGAYKVADTGRMKSGWESLKRMRRDSVADESRKLSADDWPAVVRQFESGAYRMVALCNERDLKQEGELMHHCVGDYGSTCRYEPFQIFSVQYKKSGVRVATLSLREKKPGDWDIDQLKGPSNESVDTRVWQEASGLLSTMNRVSSEDDKLRKFLDLVHSLGPAP